MPIFEFAKNEIRPLQETTFASSGLRERQDLQRLLKDSVEIIAPDALVIAEEFGQWEDSKRRIDLLAIDRDANLVVIELKRTEDGGHMELQSIRYAAMVSAMTFDQAAMAFAGYLKSTGRGDLDAQSEILRFLEWEQPREDEFAQDVRIVLASAEFSRELTSSVLWLRDRRIDVRCFRLKPYSFEGRILVDVQQIIPLPEAEDYQVQIREKNLKERQTRTTNIEFMRFDVGIDGELRRSLWKREAIFFICRKLCDLGVKPEEITQLFDWRPSRVWLSVNGTVDGLGFSKLASQQASASGSSFDSRRWFCDGEDLLHADGKTYAFSSQWGGANWYKAVELLKKTYPQFSISSEKCPEP